MQKCLESHVFCTSVKCAATVYVCGGRLRQQPQGDPITIEIFDGGRQETKYHFFGPPDAGFQIADIVAAYSILARGVPSGFVPKKEVLSIVENLEHPIHACSKALNERDRFHQLYLDTAKKGVVMTSKGSFSTNQTKFAACLSSLGHKESGCDYDGRSVFFLFENTPEIQELYDAYCSAWNNLKLPQAHPLYWMKSVLDRRDELLQQKRRVEPFFIEQRGTRTIKTPIHITPENLEKSKKYLHS